MAAFRQRFGQGGSARLSAVQCNGIVIASALKVLYLASRLAVILALASAIGCNVRPAEQANLPIASPKVIAFENDFEMVRPGQTYYHEFEIPNPSDRTWTIRHISSGCSCAAATRSSSKTINPGANELIEVSYTATGGTSNDRREISVQFQEVGAPVVKLVLHAKIREPLSVLVKKNEISLGPEETFVGEVEVYNFTDNEWAGVQVSPSVDWLTVDAISDSPPENPSGVGEPLQGWRIHYKVSAEALGFGYHRALLDVDAGELSKSLNLVFQVRSPVVVIPSEFLFLSVDPQKGATESLTLRTKDHEVTPTMVTLTPVDVPVGFAFEVTRANELLTLTGTIPPGVESGSVSGHVELTFEGVSLPSIRIPVRAIVR